MNKIIIFYSYSGNSKAFAEKLQDAANGNADAEVENVLIQAAVDASDCDIPEAMIESELDQMMREMRMSMAYQGIRMEDFLQYTGQTMDQLRESRRGDAVNRVKTQLVLEAIGKAEGIEVGEEDTDKAIREEAEREGREYEDFKAGLNDRQKEYLRDTAMLRKTIDMIRNCAVIEDKDESERIKASDAVNAVSEAVSAVEKIAEDGEAEDGEDKKDE